MDTVKLLRELSDQFGVSGFEGEVRDWIYAKVKDKVDDIRIDVLGNLMATINPGRDFIVMIDAHMDEIGIMVNYVEEDGFLRFTPIGGWDPRVLPAKQVEIRSRNGGVWRSRRSHEDRSQVFRGILCQESSVQRPEDN